MSQYIEATAEGQGYYHVYVDGIAHTKHLAEREALESAGKAKRDNPESKVYYIHDYRVRIDLVSKPVVIDPVPEPEPPIITPPASEDARVLKGGWRIAQEFAGGSLAIDFATRRAWMYGHQQSEQIVELQLPEMGIGTDFSKWPIVYPSRIVPRNWGVGYPNGIAFWQGKFWVSPRVYYDTAPPSTLTITAEDGETKTINLPRQAFSGFVKRGPGVEPLLGSGGYESGQGWTRGPSLATMAGEILIHFPQTNEWNGCEVREGNYSVDQDGWVGMNPRNGEGRWACDRVYGGGLILPEGICYWPRMGTGRLDYNRQNTTFGEVDKCYKYTYDPATYKLKSYGLAGIGMVGGQEIDAEGNVYLAVRDSWGSGMYNVDVAIRVWGEE